MGWSLTPEWYYYVVTCIDAALKPWYRTWSCCVNDNFMCGSSRFESASVDPPSKKLFGWQFFATAFPYPSLLGRKPISTHPLYGRCRRVGFSSLGDTKSSFFFNGWSEGCHNGPWNMIEIIQFNHVTNSLRRICILTMACIASAILAGLVMAMQNQFTQLGVILLSLRISRSFIRSQ